MQGPNDGGPVETLVDGAMLDLICAGYADLRTCPGPGSDRGGAPATIRAAAAHSRSLGWRA